MSALTVRNLSEDIVRRLRIRAAHHGRSAEAEHRQILSMALTVEDERDAGRQAALDRLAAFRDRTGGRGSPAVTELLAESREGRSEALTDSTSA